MLRVWLPVDSSPHFQLWASSEVLWRTPVRFFFPGLDLCHNVVIWSAHTPEGQVTEFVDRRSHTDTFAVAVVCKLTTQTCLPGCRYQPTAASVGLNSGVSAAKMLGLKKKKTFKEREVVGLRAGRVPMREEIVWNAGMHSHPGRLNKLPVNAAEGQKTGISRKAQWPPSGGWNPTNFIMENTHIHTHTRAVIRQKPVDAVFRLIH